MAEAGAAELDQVGVVVAVVLNAAVVGHDILAEHDFQFLAGLRAVRAQGVEQGDVRSPDARAFEFGQKRRQDPLVGRRTGDVGVNDGDLLPGFDQVAKGRRADGLTHGLDQGAPLVGQAFDVFGLDHHGIGGHLHIETGLTIGQVDSLRSVLAHRLPRASFRQVSPVNAVRVSAGTGVPHSGHMPLTFPVRL